MAPSLAGAAQDLRDELGAVDVHSDISEPDTSDDEVARATATAKRTASKDLESRMARIREQGKNKPPTKPHWTRARPEDDGPSEMSAAAAELRGAFDADYEAEEAEEASPVRRRADSPAMPRARNETQIMLEEAARRLSPEPPVLSWRRGDEVSCKFRATGKWVDATVLGPAAATAKGPAGYDVKYEDGGVVERHVPPTLLRPREGAERDAGPSKGFGRVDAAAAPAAPAAPKPPRPARPAPPRPKPAQEAKAAPPAHVAQDSAPPQPEAKAPPPANVAQDAPAGLPEPKPATDAPPAQPGAKAPPPAHVAQDASSPAPPEPKPAPADAPPAKAPPPANVAQDVPAPADAPPAQPEPKPAPDAPPARPGAKAPPPANVAQDTPPVQPEPKPSAQEAPAAKAPPPPTVAQDAPVPRPEAEAPRVPRPAPEPEKPWVPKRADLADEEEKDEPLPSDEPSADEAEDAEPPVFVAAEDLAPRWHRGDRALVRDGGTSNFLEGKVAHTLPNGGAAVKFGTEVIDVDAGRLKPPQDVFARAAAAASVQLRAFLLGRSGGGTPQEQRRNLVKAFKAADADRSGTMDRNEFLALLKDAGLRVDVDRATARADVRIVKCPAPRAPVELDHAAVAVLVARRASGDIKAGDELLSIGEKTVKREADRLRGDDDLDLATLPAAMLKHKGEWRVRRTTTKYLSKREADALMRCVGLSLDDATSLENIVSFAFDDAPEGQEPELAVAMDAAARCLRGKTEDDVDAAFDACRKALGTTATTIETTKLVSYLCQADLELPAPGYGLGGPQDDEGSSRRGLTPRKAHLVVRRCLDPSGDGVVTKDEFSAFAFWPTRTVEGLRRAALTAAFQLPDDGDLTPGRRLFTALDEDGNGCLGRAELARGLARLGAPLLPNERRLLSQALDVDGDGATTRKEFLTFLGEKVDDLDDRIVPTPKKVPAVPKPSPRRPRRPEASYHPKPKVSEKTKEALAVWITRCLALEEDNKGLNRKVRELTRDLKKAVRPKAEEPDPELAMELEALAAKNDALEVQVAEFELWKTETLKQHDEEKNTIKTELEESYRERVRTAEAGQRKDMLNAKRLQRELAALKAQKETKVVVKDAYFSRKGSTSIIKEKEALQAKLKDRDKEIADLKYRIERYKKGERALHRAWQKACVRGDKYREAARATEVDCVNRLRRTKSQMDEACLKAEGAVDESVLPSEEDVQRLTKQETRAFRGRRQFPAASASTVEIS